MRCWREANVSEVSPVTSPTSPIPSPSLADGKFQHGLLATVARNTAFVLGAQVVLKVLAFLFNVYVVRRLGAAHFGQYSAIIAYVSIFAIFTDWGMAPYAIREMAEDTHKTSWLLPNIVAIRLILSLIITIIAPLSAHWLGKEDEMVLGIFIASAGLLIYAFQGPLDTALTARERLDYTATYSVVNQLVFWSLGVVLLLRGMGFIGLIVASLSGVMVAAVLAGRALCKLGIGRLTLSVRRWPKLLLDALPFGISDIAYVIMQHFDTVLMSFLLSNAAVGWYNVPYTLINMILLIAQSIAIAMYPSMVRGYKANPESLRNVARQAIKYLLILCLPIAVGGTILAKPIITTLYTEEFANSVPVLQLMLWALPSLFLLEVLGRMANTLHLERPVARVNIINACFTVLLNLTLIPTLGVLGGALALVVGRAARLGQTWLLIGNERLIGKHWKPLFRVALAAALMGVAVFLLRNANLFLCIGCGAMVYGGLLVALRAVGRNELQLVSGLLLQRAKLGKTA